MEVREEEEEEEGGKGRRGMQYIYFHQELIYSY